MRKKKLKIKKIVPKAQTTCLMLFGPVFVIAVHPNPHIVQAFLWAFVGIVRAKGVVGVVQPADVVMNLRNGPISKTENLK